MNVFYKLNKKGVTVLIASHRDDPLIEFSRIITLDKGMITSR